MDNVISQQIDESKKLTECLFCDTEISGPIRDTFIRAMEWIGDSITREHPDSKIVDLCTALETLLATEQDKKKGELIALRMTLLCALLGQLFFSPSQLLEIYIKRSKIVHGSQRDICTDTDYVTARRIALDVFQKCLTFVKNNKITRHSKFIKKIEDDKTLVKKAVEMWKVWHPLYYEDVAKAAAPLLGDASSGASC